MTTKVERLPYGVGRLGGGWIVLVVVLLTAIGLGGYAYSRQLIEGEVVTGLRNVGPMGGVTWGLYVAIYIYLMGLSFAGITLAVLIRLFNLEHLKPISRMAQAMTVFTLIAAALGVIVDVGQPGRALLNLLRYARPQSPFFGTFTLVIAGYMFASLVYLYLDGRRDAAILAQQPGKLQGFYNRWAAGYRDTRAEQERHTRASFWLAIAILPLLITATSTLGFVFGLQVGRPGWFSALQAPGFVILASLSGVGMLIVVAAVLRKTLSIQDRLPLETFMRLGNVLLVLTIIYLYFTVVEWLSSFYTAGQHEVRLTTALIAGEYAWLFWITIACLALPLGLLAFQYLRRRPNLSTIVFSGVLVNLAAIGKRYLVVVPSQTHGTLLPYPVGSYSPTWVEYSVVLGLFALGTLLFALFAKVFPIMEVKE